MSKYFCPKCGGVNDINITDAIIGRICECETKCKKCGHENYWAYGHYQYEHEDNERFINLEGCCSE